MRLHLAILLSVSIFCWSTGWAVSGATARAKVQAVRPLDQFPIDSQAYFTRARKWIWLLEISKDGTKVGWIASEYEGEVDQSDSSEDEENRLSRADPAPTPVNEMSHGC